MSSQFGNVFKVSTWGESHGKAVGVVIDGCPSRIAIDEEIIQVELDKRRPGQSNIVTPRNELDKCEILSGTFNGITTGTPISIIVRNKDQKSNSYKNITDKYRPSHADYTYEKKYCIRDHRGGGRASARETIARVAGGAIAKQIILKEYPSFQIIAFVRSIHKIKCEIKNENINTDIINDNIVRTASYETAKKMENFILKCKKNGDSTGGIIECIIKNCPIGVGEPIFDRLEADLAKAMLSIPASKGFEFGSGFSGTKLLGSEHNDEFFINNDKISTKTNFSGGIQGGISNGEDIYFKVAFKPTATILMKQRTVNSKKEECTIKMQGRHDPCVLPRAVPIVESMAYLTLCDHILRKNTY